LVTPSSTLLGVVMGLTLSNENSMAERPCSHASRPLAQMFGDVWEWTQSPYAPYPG
jgi:hypothetical protein